MKSRILAAAVALVTFLTVPALAATFRVDAIHSTVIFRVKHMNASYAYGRFNNLSGSFTIDEANPANSSFDFTVKVDSIDTADAKRDGHLKNTDFFNAKQFPTITFKSKSVKAAAKGEYEVTGDLTLHGVTKSITTKIAHTGTSKGMGNTTIAGIESTFTIKRSDFGMKNMLQMIGDDVTITVSSEGGAR
jgi:polyisoprenoid-binding protein YceI